MEDECAAVVDADGTRRMHQTRHMCCSLVVTQSTWKTVLAVKWPKIQVADSLY